MAGNELDKTETQCYVHHLLIHAAGSCTTPQENVHWHNKS